MSMQVDTYYKMDTAKSVTANPNFQERFRFVRAYIYSAMDISHSVAVARGWWEKPRDVGTIYALIHSEISEAFETARKGGTKSDEHCPEFTNEEIELADALHRIFDYAAAKNMRLGAAFIAKAEYNMIREDHSLAARNAEGGKVV